MDSADKRTEEVLRAAETWWARKPDPRLAREGTYICDACGIAIRDKAGTCLVGGWMRCRSCTERLLSRWEEEERALLGERIAEENRRARELDRESLASKSLGIRLEGRAHGSFFALRRSMSPPADLVDTAPLEDKKSLARQSAERWWERVGGPWALLNEYDIEESRTYLCGLCESRIGDQEGTSLLADTMRCRDCTNQLFAEWDAEKR